MSDFEWIQEHLHEYHQDEVPPCGTGEEGCMVIMVLMTIVAVAFVLIQFVLPHFGIHIDLLEIFHDLFNG